MSDDRQSRKKRPKAAYLTWTDASAGIQQLVFDLVEDETWTGGSTVSEHPVEEGPNISDHVRPQLRTCALRVFATNTPIDANQWTDVSLQNALSLHLPGYTFAPDASALDVLDWDAHLRERVLAGSAGGAIGGAIGGPVGGIIGGAVASAIAGALFEGEIVHKSLKVTAGLKPHGAPPPLSPLTLVVGQEGDYVAQTIALLEDLVARRQTVDVLGTKSACLGPRGFGGMVIEALTHSRNSETGTGASISIGLKEIRVVSTTTVPAPKATEPRAKAPVKKGNQEALLAEMAGNFSKGETQGERDVNFVLTGESNPHK